MRRADRIEIGAFDEDISGGFRASRALTAHDPAEADGSGTISDNADFGASRIGFAVERRDYFSGLAQTRF